MRFPLDKYTLTNGFSPRHPANDLAAPKGTAIKAPESGVITSVNNNAKAYFGGKYIKMRGNSGNVYYMGHNDSNSVKVNQRVKEGQKIGGVGQTGFAVPDYGISAPTGPHIHFQVWVNGELIDPSVIIKPMKRSRTQLLADALKRARAKIAARDKQISLLERALQLTRNALNKLRGK